MKAFYLAIIIDSLTQILMDDCFTNHSKLGINYIYFSFVVSTIRKVVHFKANWHLWWCSLILQWDDVSSEYFRCCHQIVNVCRLEICYPSRPVFRIIGQADVKETSVFFSHELMQIDLWRSNNHWILSFEYSFRYNSSIYLFF